MTAAMFGDDGGVGRPLPRDALRAGNCHRVQLDPLATAVDDDDVEPPDIAFREGVPGDQARSPADGAAEADGEIRDDLEPAAAGIRRPGRRIGAVVADITIPVRIAVCLIGVWEED